MVRTVRVKSGCLFRFNYCLISFFSAIPLIRYFQAFDLFWVKELQLERKAYEARTFFSISAVNVRGDAVRRSSLNSVSSSGGCGLSNSVPPKDFRITENPLENPTV